MRLVTTRQFYGLRAKNGTGVGPGAKPKTESATFSTLWISHVQHSLAGPISARSFSSARRVRRET